jgi:hypothetical protein
VFNRENGRMSTNPLHVVLKSWLAEKILAPRRVHEFTGCCNRYGRPATLTEPTFKNEAAPTVRLGLRSIALSLSVEALLPFGVYIGRKAQRS